MYKKTKFCLEITLLVNSIVLTNGFINITQYNIYDSKCLENLEKNYQKE